MGPDEVTGTLRNKDVQVKTNFYKIVVGPKATCGPEFLGFKREKGNTN